MVAADAALAAAESASAAVRRALLPELLDLRAESLAATGRPGEAIDSWTAAAALALGGRSTPRPAGSAGWPRPSGRPVASEAREAYVDRAADACRSTAPELEHLAVQALRARIRSRLAARGRRRGRRAAGRAVATDRLARGRGRVQAGAGGAAPGRSRARRRRAAVGRSTSASGSAQHGQRRPARASPRPTATPRRADRADRTAPDRASSRPPTSVSCQAAEAANAPIAKTSAAPARAASRLSRCPTTIAAKVAMSPG